MTSHYIRFIIKTMKRYGDKEEDKILVSRSGFLIIISDSRLMSSLSQIVIISSSDEM